MPAARFPHAEHSAVEASTSPVDRGSAASGPLPEGSTVLVVDDDRRRRELLARSLVAAGARHVMQAGTAEQARRHMLTGRPCELAVVDLHLPDDDALGLVSELSVRGGHILVLGGPDEAAAAREAFRAGAIGYLPSPSSTPPRPATPMPSQPTSPSVARSANGAVVTGVDDSPCALSLREVQVLQSVADGHPNHRIGAELGLSALTVKSHLSRIGRKLGTGDRAQMVVLAMRAGVVR